MGQKSKVRFNPYGNPLSGETVWAEEVGANLYRLLNIPFYAEGYAEQDIVRCVDRNEWKEVVGVEKDSGNGTVRLMFTNSQNPEAQQILDQLVSVGCTYERASSQLVAVTVPPNLAVPFSQMASYLNSTSDNVLVGWEVAKRLTRSTISK